LHPKLIQYPQALFLNDDFIKHHPATPHTATYAEFAFIHGNLFPGFCQIVSRNQASRATTDNRNIKVQMIHQFLVIAVYNCPGNQYFIKSHNTFPSFSIQSFSMG